MAEVRKVSISVSLDPLQIEGLNEIHKRTKVPRSVLVREAIEEYLVRYQSRRGNGGRDRKSKK